MIRLIAEVTTNAINNEKETNEDDVAHDIQGISFEEVSGTSAANEEQPEE